MNVYFIRDLTVKMMMAVSCTIIIKIGVMLRNRSDYVIFSY